MSRLLLIYYFALSRFGIPLLMLLIRSIPFNSLVQFGSLGCAPARSLEVNFAISALCLFACQLARLAPVCLRAARLLAFCARRPKRRRRMATKWNEMLLPSPLLCVLSRCTLKARAHALSHSTPSSCAQVRLSPLVLWQVRLLTFLSGARANPQDNATDSSTIFRRSSPRFRDT